VHGASILLQGLVVGLSDLFNGVTHQNACSAVFFEGYRTLGIPALGQAGRAKDAAFFLQAAPVCGHDAKGRRSAKQIHDLGFVLGKQDRLQSLV
jgi:hypothetical protein